MKKILLSLTLFLVILLSTPFIDGYLFKASFYKKIDAFNDLLLSNKIPFQLVVSDYQMNWLSSTAKINIVDSSVSLISSRYQRYDYSLTDQADSRARKQLSFNVNISHGPIVTFQDQAHFALAAMQIDLQAMMTASTSLNIGLKNDIFVPFSGEWQQHLFVPRFSLAHNLGVMATLAPSVPQTTAEFNYRFSKDERSIKDVDYVVNMDAIDISMPFGLFYAGSLITAPITSKGTLTALSNGTWDREFEIQTDKINLREQRQMGFDITNIKFYTLAQQITDQTYDNIKKLSIKSATFLTPNATLLPFNNIDSLVTEVQFKNLSMPFKSYNVEALYDVMLYTPKSQFNFNFAMHTELGGVRLNEKLYWPKELAQFNSFNSLRENRIIDIQFNIAYPLLEKIMTDGNRFNLEKNRFDQLINTLLLNGFIRKENNELMLNMQIGYKMATMNGKNMQEAINLLDSMQFSDLTSTIYYAIDGIGSKAITPPAKLQAEELVSAVNTVGLYFPSQTENSDARMQRLKHMRFVKQTSWNGAVTIADVTPTTVTIAFNPAPPAKVCKEFLENSLSTFLPDKRSKIHPDATCSKIVYGVITLPDDLNAPGIHITSATYGSNCNVAPGNATILLGNECNRKMDCDYQIKTNILGDPKVGCAKDFVAKWRCGTEATEQQTMVNEEANQKWINLSCNPEKIKAINQANINPNPVGVGVQVTSATYGENCGAVHGNKTKWLAKACNGVSACHYVINTSVIGDPAYGCANDFVAEWQCGKNKTLHRSYVGSEAGNNKEVELSCPTK